MSAAGVSILKGASRYELADEVQVTPAPKLCGASRQFVRCLSVRGPSALLTDVDVASRVIERRIEGLPLMHRLWFHPAGYSLGYRKSAPIGSPTGLFFLDPQGVLLESVVLPDAASEVVPGLRGWYVGCRDSRLYCFDVDGRQLWRRRVRVPARYYIPGVSAWERAPSLLVGGEMGSVVAAAERRVWLWDEFGNSRWERDIPPEPRSDEIVIGPSEVPTRAQLLERLGFSPDGDSDQAQTGFIRLELKAQGRAGFEWVRKVEKHERTCTKVANADDLAEAAVEVVMAGTGPSNTIRTIATSMEQLALGLSSGQVQLWGADGQPQQSFRVGEAPVSVVVMDELRLRASYAGGLLTLFEGACITGQVQLPEYFASVVPCGSEVMAWNGGEAWVVDRKGGVVWRAKFAKKIGGVVVHRVGFDVLAGRLFCFQRTQQA